MNILVGAEFSGVVRDAFLRRGHNAYSCDLRPCESTYYRGRERHLQCDVRKALAHHSNRWDIFIAHLPCTYMANSSVQWLSRFPRKPKADVLYGPMRVAALERAGALWREVEQLSADIEHVAFENPIPHKYALAEIGRSYTQIIQPWMFGHREIKATCLWLRGLSPLVPTDNVGPPPKDIKERRKWAKCHQASPGPQREKERSRTLQGIGDAFAEQWGIF